MTLPIISIPCDKKVAEGGINLTNLIELAQTIGIALPENAPRRSAAFKRELCRLINEIQDEQQATLAYRTLRRWNIVPSFYVESIDESDTKVVGDALRYKVKWRGFKEPTYEPVENVRKMKEYAGEKENAEKKEETVVVVASATQAPEVAAVVPTVVSAKERAPRKETRGSALMQEHLRCTEERGYKINVAKRVGVGATSSVYCVGQYCNEIVKVVEFGLQQASGGSYDASDFENEVAMQRVASDLRIAPRYIDHFVCTHRGTKKQYGYLFMEKCDATLDEKQEQTSNIKKQLEAILTVMRQNDLVHGDLRAPNVALKAKEVALIDWGKAFRPSKLGEKALPKHIKLLKQSLGIGGEKTTSAFDVDKVMLDRL